MNIENLLLEYGPLVGYLVLLLGSFVEGESVVLTAGYFSYKGYLSFPLIILISFLGSAIADQSLFFWGRSHGMKWLKKRPNLQVKANKAFKLLHKYNTLFIMGFRFIYGIRTISPFVIGTSGVTVKRFAVLNLLAAAIWASISCYAGYLIGHFFADEIDYGMSQVMKYQKIALISILLLVIVFIIFLYYKQRKEN